MTTTTPADHHFPPCYYLRDGDIFTPTQDIQQKIEDYYARARQ